MPKNNHRDQGQGVSKEQQEQLKESISRLVKYIDDDIIGRGKNGKKPKGLECIINGTITKTKTIDSGLCRECGERIRDRKKK
jgi:hypothetical protein